MTSLKPALTKISLLILSFSIDVSSGEEASNFNLLLGKLSYPIILAISSMTSSLISISYRWDGQVNSIRCFFNLTSNSRAFKSFMALGTGIAVPRLESMNSLVIDIFFVLYFLDCLKKFEKSPPRISA